MDNTVVEAARRDIPFLKGRIFLNHAAISPIPRSVQQAMLRATELHVEVLAASEVSAHAEYSRGRSLGEALVGAQQGHVAYVQNTSIGMSMIAAGVDWKMGDNVVVPSMEFPSNLLTWLQLEAKGVEVRRVDVVDGKVTVDALRPFVDAKTRVVALSHVQYYNGYRVTLAPIGELCRSHNALLIVDGTQSIGALALDVGTCGVDVLVVASHKWMLGPVGTGFMAFSPRAMERIRPALVGWLSVREPFAFHRTLDFLETAERFEPGSENSVGIFGLTQRFETITDIGMRAIEARVLALGDFLRDKAIRAGLEVMNPLEAHERSGIVLLRDPSRCAQATYETLKGNHVLTSVRSGAIRVSPHFHNTFDEIEQAVDLMSAGSGLPMHAQC